MVENLHCQDGIWGHTSCLSKKYSEFQCTFKWKVIKPEYVIQRCHVRCRNLPFVELSLECSRDFFFFLLGFFISMAAKKCPTSVHVLYVLSSRILNSCWVGFPLHCALWVNGFLVSVQPLHCVLVGLIAFVPSFGLFPYVFFFFFLKTNFFQVLKSPKEESKISPWERLKVFTLGTANLF